MHHYDYIIIGAGAAGLLLADALGKDTHFDSKSILILDKEDKTQNDRTWCFWEEGSGKFDAIVHKKWDKVFVAGKNLQLSSQITPYSYKMVRGLDFYNHYLPIVKSCPNINWQQENVLQILETGNYAEVRTEGNQYTCSKVFSSIFTPETLYKQSRFPVLQQHFLGWFVHTQKPVFDSTQATFMDFSVSQKGNTRFMYVLPLSENKALVEYTLFSEKLLKKEEYEEAIKEYMRVNFDDTSYDIVETEFGSIPMTCYPFHQHNTANIINIGIAGGWAKPSTGFTFYNTSKQISMLVDFLKTGKPLDIFYSKSRYWLYDLLLLDILYKHNHLGQSIFESMFKKRKASLILKFLGNETTFWEDLKIISACPKSPFLKALWNRLF
ncbi:lycopene cyclase family protein [Flagellimonas nanhaiensis]|uniref:Lycopene cyclase n=1 Tax=Flagellimonas nanhaiensis TaxID=2292706 RepID=A0A371JR86_9FLAO|nr:lycopene cyclase family protein [Allomuricauda nanhaiensis]RDY60028.1 lycopene cyclase [Allomuricauda nanhaiensis]